MADQKERRDVKIAGLLRSREMAENAGDSSVARACSADLARIGYRGPELETVEAPGMPDAADPPRAARKQTRKETRA